MDMDLVCMESGSEKELRAPLDKAIIGDDKALARLLKTEEYYIPSSYFDTVQPDITPTIRKIVTEWMFEVCAEQKCLDEVFPLAVNIMDRFLCAQQTSRRTLQLVAVGCMLIASKLREPDPIPVDTLVLYTDKSVTHEQIVMMETKLAVTLRYDLLAVTANDFIAHILYRLPIRLTDSKVQSHAQTLIALCSRDTKFIMHPPSLIAGACVIAALRGLHYRSQPGCSLSELLEFLHPLLGIDKDFLSTCHQQVEDMVSAEFRPESHATAAAVPSNKANTPTDVEAIDF